MKSLGNSDTTIQPQPAVRYQVYNPLGLQTHRESHQRWLPHLAVKLPLLLWPWDITGVDGCLYTPSSHRQMELFRIEKKTMNHLSLTHLGQQSIIFKRHAIFDPYCHLTVHVRSQNPIPSRLYFQFMTVFQGLKLGLSSIGSILTAQCTPE